jgi:hypothetical protein
MNIKEIDHYENDWKSFTGLMLATVSAMAKPVTVHIAYTNIKSMSPKLTNQDCQKIITSGSYSMDQEQKITHRVNKQHSIKNSHTAIERAEGNDHVLVKLGDAVINSPKGNFIVKRISYLRLHKDKTASGILVLDGLCRADFTSAR